MGRRTALAHLLSNRKDASPETLLALKTLHYLNGWLGATLVVEPGELSVTKLYPVFLPSLFQDSGRNLSGQCCVG